MRCAITIAALFTLAGCKQSSASGSGSGTGTGTGTGTGEAALKVRDGDGRTVVLRRAARRIASLSPANSEILFAVGCGERVVLRDRATDYPKAATKLPATDPFHLSPTHVAGYRPDLVLLSHADAARVTVLRRVGMAVASFDPKTLEQVWQSVVAIGTLCGAEQRARELVQALRARVAAVERRVAGRERPRVYIEIDGSDPARPWVAGKGSFVDDLLRRAGGTNALSRLSKPFMQISAETVALADPEIVLIPVAPAYRGRMRQRLTRRPGWSKLRAVAAGKVIDTISRNELSRPGPRLAGGLEALGRALHPQAFAK